MSDKPPGPQDVDLASLDFSTLPFVVEHLALYDTDPEAAHMWDSTAAGGEGLQPTLVLHTIGRKSGSRKRTPLIYTKAGDGYNIAASKGGFPTHPAWFLNLREMTEVEVQVASASFVATWRVLEGAERAEAWEAMSEQYPPYRDYATATDRIIPVVRLEKAT